jgi:hypothetical protein
MIDLSDPTIAAAASARLLLTCIFLGTPALVRALRVLRAQRALGTLHWHIVPLRIH